MTREEIEKAARDYVDISIDEKQIYSDISLVKSAAIVDFIAGVEFINKYWQEKTRWINPREQRPEIEETPYHVLYKRYDGMIGVHRIMVDYDIAFLLMNCVGWKEID